MRPSRWVTLGLAALTALSIPPLVALREKWRRGDVLPDPAADEFDLAVIFDGADVASTAKALVDADVLVWYGGASLDLSGANLDPAGARLRVRCIFGGIDIIVPAAWSVAVRSRAIFGGVGDMTDQRDSAGPGLRIEALALFGGIGVRNPEADDHAADQLASMGADGTEAFRA